MHHWCRRVQVPSGRHLLTGNKLSPRPIYNNSIHMCSAPASQPTSIHSKLKIFEWHIKELHDGLLHPKFIITIVHLSRILPKAQQPSHLWRRYFHSALVVYICLFVCLDLKNFTNSISDWKVNGTWHLMRGDIHLNRLLCLVFKSRS